jgi:uncharacterized protein (DUF736 family)|tara:strand:+ start:3406 stop:3633 length:228 start_codon:yes stop_codon:yes gene_type:complete
MANDFEQKPGRGSMFVNSNKNEESKHDYFGSFVPDFDIKAGTEVKFNAYNNKSEGGREYIGLQIKNPDFKKKPPF